MSITYHCQISWYLPSLQLFYWSLEDTVVQILFNLRYVSNLILPSLSYSLSFDFLIFPKKQFIGVILIMVPLSTLLWKPFLLKYSLCNLISLPFFMVSRWLINKHSILSNWIAGYERSPFTNIVCYGRWVRNILVLCGVDGTTWTKLQPWPKWNALSAFCIIKGSLPHPFSLSPSPLSCCRFLKVSSISIYLPSEPQTDCTQHMTRDLF